MRIITKFVQLYQKITHSSRKIDKKEVEKALIQKHLCFEINFVLFYSIPNYY